MQKIKPCRGYETNTRRENKASNRQYMNKHNENKAKTKAKENKEAANIVKDLLTDQEEQSQNKRK